MSGARPKNVVEDGDGLWLAKFPNPERPVEQRTRGGRDAGAGRRMRNPHRGVSHPGRGRQGCPAREAFDPTRTDEGYLRHRMVSGLTILGAEDTYGDRGKWSYLLLADELRRRSARPAQDLRELFRRMAFTRSSRTPMTIRATTR